MDSVAVYRKRITQDDKGHEHWSFVLDNSFATKREAIEYAAHKNSQTSSAFHYWFNSKQNIADFMKVFTTHDRYVLHRVYYVGEVPRQKLAEKLEGCTSVTADL